MDNIQLVASIAAGIPGFSSVSIRPQEPHVKTEDSEIIEIISSDDKMEVEASLQLSGMSSDPPDPSDSLDHNDSDDEPADLVSVALSTTFWGDTNIIPCAIGGVATINRQGKVECVEYLDQILSFFPVPRKQGRIYP
ncbi:hypothetical protein B0H14DRAFT_2622726 [Mycena olivaceomarginata]|nr:hypothetical protein B0H14DRAFT_2622726 [Mycena olivaceomarginata]